MTDTATLHDGDLDHVAGPLHGTTVTLPDGRTTDVHVDGPDGPAVLLICGLGQHRTDWPPELLARLHEAGYRTVVADNRDAGRASIAPGRLEDLPTGDDGWPVPPYALASFADDLAVVLDAVDVPRAHVVGVSMGGMIAQHLALAHPDRVVTLTSVMSTTGARTVGYPHERAKPILTTVPPTGTRDAWIDHALTMQRLLASPGHVEEDRVAARARVKWARGLAPLGTARQLLAIRADGDRTGRLGAITAPTLVLHGEDDPLIDVSGGHATADAIPDAKLVTIAGWGHDLPRALLDDVVQPLLTHIAGTA